MDFIVNEEEFLDIVLRTDSLDEFTIFANNYEVLKEYIECNCDHLCGEDDPEFMDVSLYCVFTLGGKLRAQFPNHYKLFKGKTSNGIGFLCNECKMNCSSTSLDMKIARFFRYKDIVETQEGLERLRTFKILKELS